MTVCVGKIRFENRSGAEKQKAKMARKGRGYVRVYLCPYCLGFHLTSMREVPS